MSMAGTISISAAVEDGLLHLAVADTGPGLSDGSGEETGHGIGLSNTRKRLKQLYPEHEMQVIAGPAGGFEVRIAFPLVFDRAGIPEEAIVK
jgi:sensor histidine kinase YesM